MNGSNFKVVEIENGIKEEYHCYFFIPPNEACCFTPGDKVMEAGESRSGWRGTPS